MSFQREIESVESVMARAEELANDLSLDAVRKWKERTGGHAIGYLPVFAPIELVTAAGMLPVGIVGGGDQVEIIRGDACFQSYICHLPRSVVELGMSGRLDACDGFLFPSTCDVIRNLSGIWQMLFPKRWVRYVDVPQDFSRERGGAWYRREMEDIVAGLEAMSGRKVTSAKLRRAIAEHDVRRAAIRRMLDARARAPWAHPSTEVYLIQRAGLVLPPLEHAALVDDYLRAAASASRPRRDNCRVVVSGAFCEQPPLGLITTLERAGCYVVDDDFLLGPRFITKDVGPVTGDPLDALVDAFLDARAPAAFIHVDDGTKGRALVKAVRDRDAEGVILLAPSFCDPALLDRPMLARALDEAGIAHVALKYAENTGQFQPIREQAGTFADSLKLWGAA